MHVHGERKTLHFLLFAIFFDFPIYYCKETDEKSFKKKGSLNGNIACLHVRTFLAFTGINLNIY